MLKRITMAFLLLAGTGLSFRSCAVWNDCGYDCSIFPAGFPVQTSSVLGLAIGIFFFALLILLALSALLDSPET